jgi:hypothetical protein
MDYFVQRGEEKFGPYTLAELQAYVQSGSILPSDLARSEGMSESVPVSQILGNIPAPQIAPTTPAPAVELVSLPPNLHWGWLLVLQILTRQLFNWIWVFVLANWARKLSSSNTSLVLVAMYPAGFLAGILAMGFGGFIGTSSLEGLGAVFIIGGLIAYVFGIFKIKAAMEDYYNSKEKINLQLSAPMTFFFSSVYLQYHVNRIARWKKTGILSLS